MSHYRKIEGQLKQLQELQTIIASMKTLSQLEMRKLTEVSGFQFEMLQTLEHIVSDYVTYFPRPAYHEEKVVWLLIGSERGFCGAFNEKLIRRLQTEWPGCQEQPWRVLAVGQKLCDQLEGLLPGHHALAGACASEEIASILTKVVVAIEKLFEAETSGTLWVLFHDNKGEDVIVQRLLPPASINVYKRYRFPPMLYLDPELFFRNFLQHYLLLRLTRLFTVSLQAENQERFRHLELAGHRLDRRRTVLASRARNLRQEAIIEEIEMILLGSGVFTPTGKAN